MCTVLLPPGVNPITVKYIISTYPCQIFPTLFPVSAPTSSPLTLYLHKSNLNKFSVMTIDLTGTGTLCFLHANQVIILIWLVTTHEIQKSRASKQLQHRHATHVHLLHIQEWESYSLPEVVAIFASDLEVFIPLLLDERVVLHCHRVPHEVFLQHQYSAH